MSSSKPCVQNHKPGDFSGSPVVRTLCFECRGCEFHPLSGELRSHVLHSTVKINKYIHIRNKCNHRLFFFYKPYCRSLGAVAEGQGTSAILPSPRGHVLKTPSSPAHLPIINDNNSSRILCRFWVASEKVIFFLTKYYNLFHFHDYRHYRAGWINKANKATSFPSHTTPI